MGLTRRKFIGSLTAGMTGLLMHHSFADQSSIKRIVFFAGKASHGYGEHEHPAGCQLLADRLNVLPNIKATVIVGKWPGDESVFNNADALVIFSDGLQSHPMTGHEATIDRLARRGVGIGFIHYALIPANKQQYKPMLDWIGGYYEPWWSVNPMWTARIDKLPTHPVTRGVKPFTIRDEWYYHMRFLPTMQRVTPLLSALPPAESLKRKDGPHSNNPHVRKAVLDEKKPQHLAWVYERQNSGRGFGFAGLHYHWNLAHDEYRKFLLNGCAWLAGLEIPKKGIASKTPSFNQLVKQVGKPPKKFKADLVKKMIDGWKHS